MVSFDAGLALTVAHYRHGNGNGDGARRDSVTLRTCTGAGPALY
ncbi:MAG: hypothetical protein ACREMM_10915 [Gemmatimonadales bacterium]